MVEKWSIPYPAYTGEEPRNVYVYLPDGMDGRERLPVLYMFDGHNVFFDETPPTAPPGAWAPTWTKRTPA